MVIDVSRRNAAAATFVDSLDDITISIMTAHELIVGARDQRDADGIDSLIKTYPVHGELARGLRAWRTNCSSAMRNQAACEPSMP